MITGLSQREIPDWQSKIIQTGMDPVVPNEAPGAEREALVALCYRIPVEIVTELYKYGRELEHDHQARKPLLPNPKRIRGLIVKR